MFHRDLASVVASGEPRANIRHASKDANELLPIIAAAKATLLL